MPNIQLPLWKFSLLFICCIKLHILCEFENLNGLPKSRALYRDSNDLNPISFDDNRKYLLKVSSKDNTQTSKWMIRALNIRSTASCIWRLCIGASSHIIKSVAMIRAASWEFFLIPHNDGSWISIGILKQECAVQPPIKSSAVIPDEVTQRTINPWPHRK